MFEEITVEPAIKEGNFADLTDSLPRINTGKSDARGIHILFVVGRAIVIYSLLLTVLCLHYTRVCGRIAEENV